MENGFSARLSIPEGVGMSHYRTQSRDTSREAEEVLMEGYRRMEPWEKIELMCELSKAAEELALSGIRMRYPDAEEAELRMRLASLRLSPTEMREAFGWTDS